MVHPDEIVHYLYNIFIEIDFSLPLSTVLERCFWAMYGIQKPIFGIEVSLHQML